MQEAVKSSHLKMSKGRSLNTYKKPLEKTKDTFFASSHRQLLGKANSILSKKQEKVTAKVEKSKSIENNKSRHGTPSKKSKDNLSHFEIAKDNTSDSDIFVKTSLSSTIERLKNNPESQKIRRITEKHEALEFDSPNLEVANSRKLKLDSSPFLI